jgi:RNase P subunit RPR2
MRCPDCNKFVPFGTDTEPEVDAEVDDDGEITGTVRIVLTCEECGQELKEASFDINADCCAEVEQHRKDNPKCEETKTLSVEDGGFELTTRTETTDRHGKPIKNSRYMKSFYGASGDFTVTCDECGETFTVHFEDEIQASGMDEMV